MKSPPKYCGNNKPKNIKMFFDGLLNANITYNSFDCAHLW